MLIAVDTGGTKTLVARFGHNGQMHDSVRFATPHDPHEYLEVLATTIHEVADDKPIEVISVAVPGVTKGNVVKWCTNLPWNDFTLSEHLQRRLGCPVFIENDANLAGLAETRALPKRVDNSLYVTISTGIGMGLIIDHQIHPALTVTEPEHMLLEYDGRLREWGSFASGRSIYQTYGKYARDIKSVAIWKQIADKISRGFLVLIPTLAPDVIIIGGSIGTYFDRYEQHLQHLLQKHLDKQFLPVDIRQAIHPEEAVIYSCYYYAVGQLDR